MSETQLDIPDELRPLGEFREVFATTVGGIIQSVIRSLIPLAMGAFLVFAADRWLVGRNWKYYALTFVGGLLVLNGLHRLVRTFLRRNQKVMIFEHGLAIWRRGVLSTYRWEQIDQIEALIARSEGAPSSFLSFRFIGTNDDGTSQSFSYHPAGDPLPNQERLWKLIEDETGKAQVASIIQDLQDGKEVTFERIVWGKTVSTRFDLTSYGIRAKPRYGISKYLDWSNLDSIQVRDLKLVVLHQHLLGEPWESEDLCDVPKYAAMILASEWAKQYQSATYQHIADEQLPVAMEQIQSGNEFTIGQFHMSLTHLRHETFTVGWSDVLYLPSFEENEIIVNATDGQQMLPYGTLTFAERCLLKSVVDKVFVDHHCPDDEDEDEYEDNDGEFDSETEEREAKSETTE
jgi:hypothetical protein